MAIYHPLTDCEPNVLDDFHYSETSAMIFQDESSDIDTEPSYSCDAELDDETIGKALSSPLFIQERENQGTGDKLITLMKKVCCPYAHSVRTKNENQVAKWNTEKSGFSLKDKKSKFSLKLEPRSRSTNFKPILIKEVFRN